ncbi:MAG TPA: LuxR C-terminal-related transcriptional regulator [Anaerolineales bacterium]|nr:LuxR C-terminal-related transcriptional regulator [Anaerolineales bacterium]
MLATKLYIPPARVNRVPRPRLIGQLNILRPLTLIAAPAGFGKTTLLSDWIPQSEYCVTWLSLDEDDNDPTRFWTYIIAALQRLRLDVGVSALTLLQSPQPPPVTSILTMLINDITDLPENFSIVLDDYHLIKTQSIHEALAFLLDHLPSQMHVILTTRADPSLPIARLRARNQLIELRAEDLRFTSDESAAFLNEAMGLKLASDDIAVLASRTEGWVAGLQLAALSLQGREDASDFIQAFSGSHRHVLTYFAEEVLKQCSEDMLNFLLQTSVLDRLCGPLCDTVTSGSNSQTLLQKLEQANLFIVPLDDDGRWYRYHHLFVDLLRAHLQQAQPDLIPELHRRALEWLEQNNLMHEAADHAFAGRDFDHAARLVERLISVKWQTGEIKTLQGWLAALPRESWRAYPRLWLVQAWVALNIGDFVEGDANLKAAEESLDSLDEETARYLRPEVNAFRASYASLVRDPRAVELTQEALRELPTNYWMRGMLVVFLGTAYYSAGQLDAALDALTQAPGSSLSESDAQPHRIHLLTVSGAVRYAKGRLNDASSFFHRAVELAEPGGKPIPFVGTLFAYMSFAPVLYEQDQLEQANHLLTRCLDLAVNFGSAEVQAYCLSLLAKICLARNDLSTALKHYDQIDILLLEHPFSISMMAFIDYRRFLLYLEQGNMTAAAIWIDAHTLQPDPLNPYAFHRIALLQFLIAQGKYDLAKEKSESLLQEAQNTGHGTLLVKALILQTLALEGLGKYAEALNALEHALLLGQPEGFVRSFVDEGEPMRKVIRHWRVETGKSKVPTEVQKRLIAYTDKLLDAFSGRATQFAINPPVLQSSLIAPLSARELEVLQLVANGLSNREIANRLFITINTVKKHIRLTFDKIDVSNRTQAVARARELGLL